MARGPIDPVHVAAHAIFTSPGTYALLIGSGVSTAAGIPTGWSITMDLAGRVAALEGDSHPDDLEAWCQERFGGDPVYSDLLARLGSTPNERHAIVRKFIEPTDEERQRGLKVPTAAHRSIAALVKGGYVRVILTTNFDQLIETALTDQGVDFDIISNDHTLDGARPLGRAECVVVKLHGDYRDPGILNTASELAEYTPKFVELLDRVLHEHGLLISGWSSTSDPALRAALERRSARRYAIWWSSLNEPTIQARHLAATSEATLIEGLDADELFGRIADQVAALETLDRRHPAELAVTVQTAKRELAGQHVAIGLHDTIARSFADLHQLPEFHPSDFSNPEPFGGLEAMRARVLEAAAVPCALVATSAYWGTDATDRWWADELDRFAVNARATGTARIITLPSVVGCSLMYAAGVSAFAAGRYDLVGAILDKQRLDPNRNRPELLAAALSPDSTLGSTSALHTYLQPLLLETLAIGDKPLDDAWQAFEVLRLTAIVLANEGSAEQIATLGSTSEELLRAQIDAAREGRTPSADLAQRATAERTAALDAVADHVRVVSPHVLTVDRFDHDVFATPAAERLANNPAITAPTSPMARLAAASARSHVADVITAVGRALGRRGRDKAYGAIPPGGGAVADEVWLDAAPARR